MEVVGDYLVPQPEPETFSNIPVCVPTNDQNNTDGDLHVVQDPDEDPDNLEDTFGTISTIMETAESINRARPDPTATPEAEIEENAVQRCRRKKKEKEKAAEERRKFLIADNTRLEATIAVHKQQLSLPQSQTFSAPPTRCVTVSESNTQAQPGKIQSASVSHRETPYTVFQCDQCNFSSRSQHGLKIHTGKAHAPASPTPAKSANAIRHERYRKNNKIKKQNAVENLESLEEQNIKLKAEENQLRIMVEQFRML